MEAAENTKYAFKNTMDLGLNMLECDIQLTKDKVVIVMHDANLGRVCGEEYEGKLVSEYDYADLPKM